VSRNWNFWHSSTPMQWHNCWNTTEQAMSYQRDHVRSGQLHLLGHCHDILPWNNPTNSSSRRQKERGCPNFHTYLAHLVWPVDETTTDDLNLQEMADDECRRLGTLQLTQFLLITRKTGL
jgi:hypothetical protein